MPQLLLPIIPHGATPISETISVVRKEQKWFYFCGAYPVFQHIENDHKSYRMFTAQLCAQGACTQAQIIRTFGVSKNSVLRSVAKFRQEGAAGFYRPRKGRGASIMTSEVTTQVQKLLDSGLSRKETAEQLNIKYDTLRKAIARGQVQETPPPTSTVEDSEKQEKLPSVSVSPSDKSSRSDLDASTANGMGIACTRPDERISAAMGLLINGATTQFQFCRDVTYGGVLCALPALAENGLFSHLDNLPVVEGYYTKMHIIVLLAYMALCRIKTVEQLQYETPGELGKLMGLDRVPEVRCLRKKLSQLSQENAPELWAAVLSKQWMEQRPELAGTLYVDGHVRVYHGKETQLPRRYIARYRLCMRGTTDYWVNDALGQPFFSVERPIDQGMLEALRFDIVVRLLKDVPDQPTTEELKSDPHKSRFVIIFDREAYSPKFFREMWEQHRIGCITYHKYPKEAWPESWFTETEVTMPNGEQILMKLAEMGTRIGSKKDGLWVREVRKLNISGHQTSLVSTVYGQMALKDAAALFSRWSQENFFAYMMKHFAIDALNEYNTEIIPGTNRPVVNPLRRELDQKYRSIKSKLTHCQARFGALTLQDESDIKDIQTWQRQKADLQEQIEQWENELSVLNEKRLATPKHLKWEELPEENKFKRLAPSRKRFTDTVKLIAYRAETALANIARDELSHQGEVRSLIRDIMRSDADIIPDGKKGVLEVRLHTLANPRSNRAAQHLLDYLNEAEFLYPGTNLRLTYSLASS